MEQFPNSVANSAIATRHELESYARLMDQERVYSAVTVPAVVDEEAVIEEEAITAWYEDNQGDYLSEEQVLIEYIELSADAIGGEVEITEEDLRARFEQQQQRFISPEARLASHILIEVDPEAPEVDIESARSQAEELAERARAGEDFAQLATEYSQDLGSADMGGDLGWIEPDYMVKAFEDGLYELTLENPISDPVQTRFGWHVIQLRDIRPSQGMTFAEARDILMEEYQAEQDERRFIEQADRLIDIIYEDPTTLQAAALELGLEVQEAGPFGRGGAEEGIAANPEVVSTAFSDLVLGQRSVSDPVNLDTNHIVLLLVKQHMPEALIPLEDVREQVAQAVRDQRARDAARARAEELLARLQAGEALEGLAVEAELEPVLSATARRQSPNMDSGLRNELFRMAIPDEGAMTTGVVEVADGYAVVQLESVSEGELVADDDVRKQLYQRRVQAATASDEMMAFIRMLREQSTIEVFEDRLQ
jgi:peptidyl-prolyl cis-trans isomerase D